MNTTMTLLAVGGLSSLVVAQTSFTSPPGFLTKDGEVAASNLGRFAEQRVQLADGLLPKKAAILGTVDYRLDLYRQYTSVTGTGRTFTSVKLALSNTDITKLTKTFSTNPTGSQTEVFSSKVTWPTVTGLVTSAPWAKQVSFPFSKAWVYQGKTDLLMDFTFRGGKLANNDPAWTGSKGRSYYLDAVHSGTFIDPPQRIFVPSISFASIPNCKDPASTLPGGAYTTMTGVVWGPKYNVPTNVNRFQVKVSSYGHAPSAPFVTAITFGGSMTGFNVGASCNKLHVDLTKQLLMLFGTADKGGSSGTQQLAGPYDGKLAGLYMWMQTAWTDSFTKGLNLTAARRVTLPAQPVVVNRRSVHNALVDSKEGYSTTGNPSGVWFSYWNIPMPRFTTK